jgi:iron complex transport system substrate-binding protein
MRRLAAPRPLSRRSFLAGALALPVAGLAACGGDGEAGPAPNPSPATPGTLTVTNEFGTFEVPAEPQRVVGWEGRRDLETAVALDLPVAGVGSNALFGDDEVAPFLDFSLDGVQVIEQTEPNLELIASLRPDLILTRDSNIADLREELAALAPLVPVAADGPWRPDLERVAGWLARQERLATVLGRYDEELAAVRERHAERIETATLGVVQYLAEEKTFYSSPADGFYLQANTIADLGGRYLPFLDQGGEALQNDGFSLEQVGELAPADALLVIVNDEENRVGLEAEPLWQQLPAVQAGHLVFTDFRTNYGSVFAATECLRLLDGLYATLTSR